MDNQNPMANLAQEIGGTSHTEVKSVNVTENKNHKYDRTGKKWEDHETNYLRDHWRSAGPTARSTWLTCMLHLHRDENDCRAEYRRITLGKAAKKKIEAKKTVVEVRETPVYNADQEIIALFRSLPLFMRCLIAELPSLGEMDEMNLNVTAGLLTVSFKRDKVPTFKQHIETDAGNIQM
jgi:hypothetical protein